MIWCAGGPDEFFFFSPISSSFEKKKWPKLEKKRGEMSYLSGHIAADLFLFTQLDRIEEEEEDKVEASFLLFRSATYK